MSLDIMLEEDWGVSGEYHPEDDNSTEESGSIWEKIIGWFRGSNEE